ncbi:hypothetical protein CSUI_006423 [Cystoisospora suis]|uniref:Secreted protein n=1 Tax=Cystoisospora suis TaxID=483139 RepID=A0A2C6KU35_9APIC|nr:hypothetical protein CSUI_006423 [Cystoisospora suis]
MGRLLLDCSSLMFVVLSSLLTSRKVRTTDDIRRRSFLNQEETKPDRKEPNARAFLLRGPAKTKSKQTSYRTNERRLVTKHEIKSQN